MTTEEIRNLVRAIAHDSLQHGILLRDEDDLIARAIGILDAHRCDRYRETCLGCRISRGLAEKAAEVAR